MATAEQQAREVEQQRRDASSSVEGARSVAEAVKRVADAAVAEAQKVKIERAGDFEIGGHPGGRFTIRGNGFTGSGTVLLGGKALPTDEWGGQLIRGKLPADAKSGEVIVWIDEKTQQRGYLKVA